MTTPPELQLVDTRDGARRTTRTLIASFVVRMHTLSVLTGGEAVASLLAGVAAHGRDVTRTADGDRLREALERGRVGDNAATLWTALRLDEAVALLPPSPVLTDLANDLALLQAPDLEACLEGLDDLEVGAALGPVAEPTEVDVLDLLVGLWALGRDAAATIEALAAPTLSDDDVEVGTSTPPGDGPLLR